METEALYEELRTLQGKLAIRLLTSIKEDWLKVAVELFHHGREVGAAVKFRRDGKEYMHAIRGGTDSLKPNSDALFARMLTDWYVTLCEDKGWAEAA